MRRSGLSAHQHEIIRDAQLASLATSEMLDTLLDFSKIEAGAIKSHPRAFSLQSLFDLLENEFSAQAGQKNLIYRSRATPLAVFADPALVGQILRNLISNAIRYTHNGGALVACRTRKIGSIRYAMIEVWDTGMGIAEAQAGKIFDEFYQLGNPERDRQKGLGLGLAIVKGIAQVMETEVVLASTPGRGSVFRLRLPLAETSIVEDVPRVELATDFDRRRVLVLDDDKMVLSGMQALLSSWNCAVDCADSIEAAVQLATRHAPDLMITDFRLREGYTGHDAINALRSKISSALPAIIITGDTSPEWLRVANSMDALLLHKPVSIGLLNAAMVKVLQPATWRSHL